MKLLFLSVFVLVLSIIPIKNLSAKIISQTNLELGVDFEGEVKINAGNEAKLPQAQKVKILPHQAKALQQIIPSDNIMKNIEITLVELTDNQGLVYLGGVVEQATLAVYLAQLKGLLNEKYTSFRQNQEIRDHGQFHVTLVNPYEYQKINKNQFTLGEKFNVSLKGLGRVEKDSSATYFVVVSSDEGQRFRQTLLLKAKDFHITLGFEPNDIYSEPKGVDTLIK